MIAMLFRLLMFLMFASAALSATKKFSYTCNILEYKPQKDSMFPTIDLESLNLQVSRRVTHQLTTRVFAIFLKDILNYQNIILDNELDTTENFNEREKEYNTLLILQEKLNASINLEVWTNPDHHFMYPESVTEGGSLSFDRARYGLFIQSSNKEDQSISYANFQADEHFGYHTLIPNFTINDIQRNIIMKNIEEYSYEHCKDGFFRPQHCRSSSEACSTVITSYYNETSFFIHHVNELKLKMNIYFLGKNLRRAIKELSSLNRDLTRTHPKYLVFHWTPSEIINGSVEFQSIIMPKCEQFDVNNDTYTGCKYEVLPVSVFYNEKVKESDELLDILKRFTMFSMAPLLKLYSEQEESIELYKRKDGNPEHNLEIIEEIYNNISCKWLAMNHKFYEYSENKTKSWLRGTDERKVLSIGGIYPRTNSPEFAGIDYVYGIARNELNNLDANFLPGYTIELKRITADCQPDVVLRSFISYYSQRKHLVGVLGPACSEAVESIAGVSKQLKMSVISYAAEGTSFKDRNLYPYMFRTIGETSQFEDVYAELFAEFEWKRIAALTEDGQKYTEYISHMENYAFKNKSIAMLVNKKFASDSNKVNQITKMKEYLPTLESTYHAKIIICDIHDYLLVEAIMCEAENLGMTAKQGYVWFLPVYVSVKLNLLENRSCPKKVLNNALNGHFALSYVAFVESDGALPNGENISEFQKKYLGRRRLNKTQFLDYAGYTYDAIWVYVKALQKMRQDDITENTGYLKNLHSDKTMKKLSDLILEMDFQGVSGHIQFSEGGSRIADIDILQWQKNDFIKVGSYKPKVSNKTILVGDLKINHSLIKWLNGKIPNDGTETCAFEMIALFLHIECRTISSIIVMFICIICILIVAMTSSFWFWKRKYDKKLVETNQYFDDIRMVVHGAELTRWQVPRENVVINRKIGEGAFGTVYGGEALIKDEDGWTAVAIKTLKPNSTVENRFDFLAESETMKRFDHKNIVKILAVCLQNEPLFVILELMLYGDLKNYLLARRHLVNDKINDDSDISPKRLTLMALDVARALSYLASIKFVHRDVACRNCMINGQRIVKLGDFGMSRPTFESDYYRFNRKGMMPIRWMAPESIDGGIFSHASDIWSYGVLLYEIITMGAFPFQGMNNNQVLENVKSGNSIKIPQKCKPQLRALMISCFSVDVDRRPSASTIVEYISNYSRMLTPCMDVPKPSLDDQVNLIDSGDQLERLEPFNDPRERSVTPHVEFLRTSVSSSALQDHRPTPTMEPSSFEYLDMKLPRKPNGIYLNDFHPDLTATLPNGNYNPVEPLLQQSSQLEITKSNLSLMKYVPMCGFGNKNSNRSSSDADETNSAL